MCDHVNAKRNDATLHVMSNESCDVFPVPILSITGAIKAATMCVCIRRELFLRKQSYHDVKFIFTDRNLTYFSHNFYAGFYANFYAIVAE